MTRTEKIINNSEIRMEWEVVQKELDNARLIGRLRTCTAWIYESDNYYFLQSYSTIIAYIDKATDTCTDILRMVYGYTATSAQHIAKFRRDYGKGKWGCQYNFRFEA